MSAKAGSIQVLHSITLFQGSYLTSSWPNLPMKESKRTIPIKWMLCNCPLLALRNQGLEGGCWVALDSRQLIMRFGNSPCQISPKYRMGKAGQKLEPKGKRLQAAQSPWEVSYWRALMARYQCVRNNTAQKTSSHSWLLVLVYVLSFRIPRRLKQKDCLRPRVRGQPRQNSRICFSK